MRNRKIRRWMLRDCTFKPGHPEYSNFICRKRKELQCAVVTRKIWPTGVWSLHYQITYREPGAVLRYAEVRNVF